MRKNGDPQTGWMKEEVLKQTGCSFQVAKFPQLSTNQGLICTVTLFKFQYPDKNFELSNNLNYPTSFFVLAAEFQF